jgi:hypothetical protein
MDRPSRSLAPTSSRGLSAVSILKRGMDPADKPREDVGAGEGWGEGVKDGKKQTLKDLIPRPLSELRNFKKTLRNKDLFILIYLFFCGNYAIFSPFVFRD